MRKVTAGMYLEDFIYCFISADRSAWVAVSYLSTLSPSYFFRLLLALQDSGILGGILQLLFCSRYCKTKGNLTLGRECKIIS